MRSPRKSTGDASTTCTAAATSDAATADAATADASQKACTKLTNLAEIHRYKRLSKEEQTCGVHGCVMHLITLPGKVFGQQLLVPETAVITLMEQGVIEPFESSVAKV